MSDAGERWATWVPRSGVLWGGEGSLDCITDMFKEDAMMSGNGLIQERVMALCSAQHGSMVPLPDPGRPLDVGEKIGDYP